MKAKTTYTAIASRDENWWLIRVPGLGNDPKDGVYTQAKLLKNVEPMARDLIAVCLDVAPNSFDVEVQRELPTAVKRHLQRAATKREKAAQLNAEAASEWRSAARALQAAGLSISDIGDALDVSKARAQQLVS